MPARITPLITCLMLDTRNLWPGQKIDDAASDVLQLLDPEEQRKARGMLQIKDARMVVASALIKRYYISKTLGIPWKSILFGRRPDPVHGKPCYLPEDGSESPIEFNVSHQAGIVVLVGCERSEAELGVDIVCVNERDDYRIIDSEGLNGWVNMFEQFFSPEEVWDMSYNVDTFQLLDGVDITPDELGRHDRCCTRGRELTVDLKNGQQRTFNSDLLIDAKLRRFYTFYCHKEAYIKLTGEAMLADWLQELEFRNVRSPKPGTVARCSTHGRWGEKANDVEVWLHGRRVEDVKMEIQAFEEDFMISIAARPASKFEGEDMPTFQNISVEDIISVGTS
ncbi:4'-phosphopantetheinyl transferase [Patellaria atrata CBS 101060]|uniref:holo-[acyl-carrier-protein] synthase n=1 Tax=Patellaria atrata CBS 101060 TaxID=1346257 RepID=A0A9P4SJG5_9PEZI|nr:4'-phosphopantetheinyl transferase [Patellaria atrata CBS 101060]